MTKRQSNRIARLLPKGEPRYIRCYDNGGESADRYTVCFTGATAVERANGYPPHYPYVAMSASPFHPQGVGLHGSVPYKHCDTNKSGFAPMMGRKCHLGIRIPFAELPKDCQTIVLRDYREIWGL